jgi:geranylgeranyl diphosphate synthase, type II
MELLNLLGGLIKIDTAAQLLIVTVEELSRRAPAIAAAAANELHDIVLGLHFGDDSHAELQSQHSRLFARLHRSDNPVVEAYFDDRALNLLFDLENRPVDQIWMASLDIRGDRDQVLSVWRMFRLLAQRASGLRVVQDFWRQYRDRRSHLWGIPAQGRQITSPEATFQAPRATGWSALDYLDQRYPKDTDRVQSTLGNTVHVNSRVLWDGHTSTPWWQLTEVIDADLMETLQGCKNRVRQEILLLVPDREPRPYLYDQIREYPAREGKGLRPTLTIATCCAFGGRAEDAIRSAAAIELFHNGFLVHDDIADESTHRRNEMTLHMEHGIGMAVNTGDAMNLLAIDAILSNLPTLGLARTLGLIHEVMHMCRETIEGQALELGWIRNHIVPTLDDDYFNMSTKKTGWYTCISPCRIGAICAGETDPQVLDRFNEVFRLVGIAFQIQDDVLNLVGEQELYGKEPLGDLLEGKRTVMMIHLLRNATDAVCERITEIIRLPRSQKSQQDAEEILAAMHQHGSIEYAVELADRLAHDGVRHFEADLAFLPESEAKAVLRQIANYVTTRPL